MYLAHFGRNSLKRAVDPRHRIHRRCDLGLGCRQATTRAARFLFRTHGKRADQIGHHGKTAPRLTRAAGFNCRVHGQNPRLERDLVDTLDHLIDPACAFAHPCHCLHCGFRNRTAFLYRIDRNVCALGGRARIRGGNLHPLLNLNQRRAGLLKARGVAFGTTRQIFRCLRNLARSRLNALGAARHRVNRLAQLGDRIVIGCRKGREIGRQPVQLIDKIAIGKTGKRPPRAADCLLPLSVRHLEIDRDRQFHIEQRRLDDGGRHSRRTGATPQPEKLAQRRITPLDPLDQFLDDQRIAANIPARRQADAGMNRSDAAHALIIFLVEPAAQNRLPMSHLRRFGAAHMIVVLEELRSFWRPCGTRIETIERRTDAFFQYRLRSRQNGTLALAHFAKFKAIGHFPRAHNIPFISHTLSLSEGILLRLF